MRRPVHGESDIAGLNRLHGSATPRIPIASLPLRHAGGNEIKKTNETAMGGDERLVRSATPHQCVARGLRSSPVAQPAPRSPNKGEAVVSVGFQETVGQVGPQGNSEDLGLRIGEEWLSEPSARHRPSPFRSFF